MISLKSSWSAVDWFFAQYSLKLVQKSRLVIGVASGGRACASGTTTIIGTAFLGQANCPRFVLTSHQSPTHSAFDKIGGKGKGQVRERRNGRNPAVCRPR